MIITKKWLVDAGHGGAYDSGAINRYVREKDLNLIVAIEVTRLLEKHNQRVLMSRTTDKYISLTGRCKKANTWGADFFVSIHHNATGRSDVKAQGAEIIHSRFGGKGKELAIKVAEVFESHGRLMRNPRVYSRNGIKNPHKDYLTVIAKTMMPSIVIEWGFLDSIDYSTFDTKEELLLEARYIAEALLSYIHVPFQENTLVDDIFDKGLITDKTYWNKVFGGILPLNLDYVKIVLDRANKKIK